MTRHSLDCPTALVIFKLTHQDRAGETGTVIRKEGEVVTKDHEGQAIIAVESGEIILCPTRALHAAAKVAGSDSETAAGHDFFAAVELVRWIPANPLPYELEWKSPGEVTELLSA